MANKGSKLSNIINKGNIVNAIVVLILFILIEFILPKIFPSIYTVKGQVIFYAVIIISILAGSALFYYLDDIKNYIKTNNSDKPIFVSGFTYLGHAGSYVENDLDVFENNLVLSILGECALALEKEIYTDENGVAVLTDLQTYEKTVLNVDTETLLDIALQPLYDEKKLVLRPGTIRTVSIPFVHRGAIEGKIANADDTRMFGYQISALDKDNKEIVSTFADIDGFFILDGIPYGTYKVIVSKDGNQLAELQDIKVDDISVYIKDEIKLDTRALAFFETKDTQEEFEQLEDLHKQGYNNVDYRNRDFPIDIPQAVLNPEKDMPHIQIEEIEKDIFVEVKAPVFDSVASVQSFERYSTIQDIETDVFSQSEGNLATVLQDLQYNTALAKALNN